MSQTFTDKNKLQTYSNFIFPNDIVDGKTVTDPQSPKKYLNRLLGLDFWDSFNLIFGESIYDRYTRAKNKLEKVPTNAIGGPAIPIEYKNYVAYKLALSNNDRKVDYTTNVPNKEEAEQKLLSLYKSVPSTGNDFNGKKL